MNIKPLICFCVTMIVGLAATADSFAQRRQIMERFEIGANPFLAQPQLPEQKKRDSADNSLEILKHHGIEPDAEGLSEFFKATTSEISNKEEARQLIEQLGSNSYEARIKAERDLIQLPQLPIDQLRAALNSDNRELAYRANIVLTNGIPERERILLVCAEFVRKKGIAGVCEELFEVADKFGENKAVVSSCRRSILATLEPTDVPLLQTRLQSGSDVAKRIAMSGLRQIPTDDIKEQFIKWASDKELDGFVRYEAALGSADQGERKTIEVLVQLMQHEDINLRVKANIALKKFTGQGFGFAAYDQLPKRTAKIDEWKEWLEKDGAEAKLYYPLADIQLGRQKLNGNMLLSMGYKNKVVELDPEGKEIWSYDKAKGCWSAEKMENGNVLIAAYQDNRVIEVNMNKKIVWEHNVPGVLNARPLNNGNVLASSHSGHKVQEISRDGKIVWEFSTSKNCHDAIRLESGNTVIALDNRIVEVDRDLNEVWDYDAKQAYGIDVLENGNVLIAQLSGSVIEVERESRKVIWEYEGKQTADVFRLENGNTLIVDSAKCYEVTPDKKVVWTKTDFNYGTARK